MTSSNCDTLYPTQRGRNDSVAGAHTLDCYASSTTERTDEQRADHSAE